MDISPFRGDGLYSEYGHALNLHGVNNTLVDGVNAAEFGKCGISLASAVNVTVQNTTIAEDGWGHSIGMMYKANNSAYETPVSLIIGEDNSFPGTIYSERDDEQLDSIRINAAFGEGKIAGTITVTAAEGVDADSSMLNQAKIGSTYYATLAAAVGAVKDNETIELLCDVTVNAEVEANDSLLTIEEVENVTLDGNGYTITANCCNANGNVLGIKGCDGVTVKDLAITKSSSGQAKHAINVYKSTNVTLTDVSMSNMGGLGLVVNASTVKATGTLSLYKNGWFDGLNAINVGWGSNVSADACSFDASEATATPASLRSAARLPASLMPTTSPATLRTPWFGLWRTASSTA